jgi:hypothetical protein
MSRLLRIATALALTVGSACVSALGDEPVRRQVKGQVVTSAEMPAARITIDGDFKYVGGHAFILYGVARAEQHFFVDADAAGKIRRLYWLQFEGYLPENTHRYDYDSPTRVGIGGLEFFADSAPFNMAAQAGRPDSDVARGRAFLASKGYTMLGDDILSQRLIHLVDEAKRNELLIVYVESLAGTGLDAAALARGGRAADRWPELSKALLARATKGLTITRSTR